MTGKHQTTTEKEKEKMGVHKTKIPGTKVEPKERNYFSQKRDSDEDEEETKMPYTPKKDEQRERGFSPKKNEPKEKTESAGHRPRA